MLTGHKSFSFLKKGVVMKVNEKGMTVLELMIVLTFVAALFVAIVLSFGINGNQWFTEEGVLHKIQLDNPDAVAVIDTERNIRRPSVIKVREKNGSVITYYLETDVFFNYKIHKQLCNGFDGISAETIAILENCYRNRQHIRVACFSI